MIMRTARNALLRGCLTAAVFLATAAGIADASSGSGKSGSGKVDDKISSQIENKVEDKAEGKAEDRTSGRVEDKIEDKAEGKAGDAADRKVDDKVSGKIEDRAGDAVAGKVEDKTSGKALDRIDNSGSSKIEGVAAAGAADKAAERAAKDALDKAQKALDATHKAELDAAKSSFERALASGADKDAAKADYEAAKDASDAAYEAGRDDARADYEAAHSSGDSGNSGSGSSGSGSSGSGSSGTSGGSGSSGHGGGSSNSGSSNSGSSCDDDEGCAQGEGDAAVFPLFEGETDDTGAVRARGELLMLAEPGEARALAAAGYETFEIDDLPALGAVLLRVRARGDMRLENVQAILREAAPAAEIDYNHVYAPSGGYSATARDATRGAVPAALMRVQGGKAIRIGVVDSKVDLSHEALAGADIVAQDFVRYRDPRPSGHGTSVVSILVGRSATFEGVAAGAKIFEASVFFQPGAGEASATAASIVRALDWLAAQSVSVVNLSLAGPPNEILKGAIERVQRRGIVVVAAVGNEGPAAPPLYPASYEGVVGVTAVSGEKRVFRLAGRGAQVDFSAPGVGIRHADEDGRYAASSGTSMAAPFVSAAIADAKARLPGDAAVVALARHAEDLGAHGLDPVFGWGLVRPLAH